MKMKGAHWLLLAGVVVLYLFAPAQFEQGKGAVFGITSKIPGLSGNSTQATPVPADPVILAVRPALTGQKIGYFDRDTNTQKYYTVTGTDITKAVKVTGDNSFSVTVRGIWRVKLSPALVPDSDWDASGTKVLKIYTLYDDHCCSSKALAAS